MLLVQMMGILQLSSIQKSSIARDTIDESLACLTEMSFAFGLPTWQVRDANRGHYVSTNIEFVHIKHGHSALMDSRIASVLGSTDY